MNDLAMEAIQPAQVAFLSIYNPSLGRTDETVQDQIVYYHSSKTSRTRKSREALAGSVEKHEHEERNEQLRQIGLAQGMIEFAKAFSDGENIDSIDSEKSRIVLHEIESGWWLLASVDLTCIQNGSKSGKSKSTPVKESPSTEFSAREVCPQELLLSQLLRAHSIFLLHHGPSLADLYVRLTRQKFCAALERFWNRYVRDWDVLLNGNPAVDIFNGLKLAAGGELGIGVGEEEWGSGERDVLEGFIGRTEGLIDVAVSRFGDIEKPTTGKSKLDLFEPWIGSGKAAGPSDGVIFSGVGAVTKASMRKVSAWMEWIYKYGQAAYGIQDNPHAPRRKKRRKVTAVKIQSPRDEASTEHTKTPAVDVEKQAQHPVQTSTSPPGIPPPIVSAATRSLERATERAKDSRSIRSQSPGSDGAGSGTDAIIKYMTLGIYGSSWGIPSGRPSGSRNTSSLRRAEGREEGTASPIQGSPLKHMEPKPIGSPDRRNQVYDSTNGCFLVGLQGDLENEDITDDEDENPGTGPELEPGSEAKSWNRRIILRTLHIERKRKIENERHYGSNDPPASEYSDRVRVLIYVRQPFIFTFLFELQSPVLSYSPFYRSIHHQLGPLQRPLLHSTSPTNVFTRLYDAVSPRTVTPIDSKQPIYDLIYDPVNLTVHTTIPSIPEAGSSSSDQDPSWLRMDALNVHSQILNTFSATRRLTSEIERTAKTSRGWWVVWMRLPGSSGSEHPSIREAFLVRRASDHATPGGTRKTSLGFGSKDSGGGWGSGAGKLAEGIGGLGIDTRRYVEGLLSLNR